MRLNNHSIILCIGIIISGCSSWIQREKSQIVHTRAYDNTVENILITRCIGKGQISSKNPLKGKLYFSFTSTRDSSHIYIKDFLGRRLYSIKENTQEISIINYQNNNIHDLNNLIQYYSLSDVVTPMVLQNYLWGKITISDMQLKDESGINIRNGSIFFSNNQSQENKLVDTVQIKLNDPKIDLTIEIIQRAFYDDPPFYQTELHN